MDVDALLSMATEENYAKLQAEIDRLVRARDVIGKMLGKVQKANGKRARQINPNSLTGRMVLSLRDGPKQGKEIGEIVGREGHEVCQFLYPLAHVENLRDGLGYRLTELGREWVEQHNGRK